MKLFCYRIPPIDFWSGAMTGRQLIESAWDTHAPLGHAEAWASTASFCQMVEVLAEKAEKGFASIGWEGDVREGPFYFALPSDGSLLIGYMIKQDNNGSCFVASPRRLEFLDAIADRPVAVEE